MRRRIVNTDQQNFLYFAATAFAPVKADINGNLGKLEKKMLSNPVRFSNLEAMIASEVEE